MGVMALAAVAHMLRTRRFYERVGIVAVVLAALARMIRENQASTRARPAGRDKRQIQPRVQPGRAPDRVRQR
jgi:hypothetical protein